MAVLDFRLYYDIGPQPCNRCSIDMVPECGCDEDSVCGCQCSESNVACRHVILGPEMVATHIEGSHILATVDNLPEGYEKGYPFKVGETVLILGELQNMPHHYAVVTEDGQIGFGFHLDLFKIVTGEES